jgi:hypothetical protein
LAVWLKPPPSDPSNVDCDATFSGSAVDTNATPLLIPWCKPPFRKARELLLPALVSRGQVRAIKAERRASLLKSIAHGRQWLDEIMSGIVQDLDQIAARHHCSARHVNMTISMAFIAPGLVNAAVEGRLPRGIGVAALRDAPAEWSLQFDRLGLIDNLCVRKKRDRSVFPCLLRQSTKFEPPGTGFLAAETDASIQANAPTGTERPRAENKKARQ